jgi:hypothetical protein
MAAKHIAVVVGLFALTSVLFSPGQNRQKKYSTKATCSLAIRPLESTVKVGSPIVIEAITTNTSNYVLNNSHPRNPGEYYSFDVRLNGVPAPETEILQMMVKPGNNAPEKKSSGPLAGRHVTSYVFEDLPPHQAFRQTVSVSEYFDMREPGEYTIQLALGKVKSNVVKVAVIPALH